MSDQHSVQIAELISLLEGDQPITVLDVRTSADRADWSIPGSQHADVYEALKAGDAKALDGFELPQNGLVVTVCGAGIVSQIAAERLRSRGIEARSLTGGMRSWSLAWNTALVSLDDVRSDIMQVRRIGKGCLSYIAGSAGEAVVVDAALDPEVYVDLANQRGWEIRHVLDTHIHADHLSRSRKLADQTGATFHRPGGDLASDFSKAIGDRAEITFGDSRLVALATPGHTMESLTYLLDEHALFTGDTLFLTSVGRPDLEASEEEALVRARLLYQSLGKLLALPGDVQILPGHTDEPIGFDSIPIAETLATVRVRVHALRSSEDDFVRHIASHLPPAPPNHAVIVALNAGGSVFEGDPADLEAGANRCAIH